MRGPTNENRRGGAQEYIRHILAPWVKRGDRVRIVCMQEQTDEGELPEKEYVDGLEVLRVGGRNDGVKLLEIVRRAHDMQKWADILVENIMTVPFLAPLWKERDLPILAVKHHLQGCTFFTKQSWIQGTIGLFLERIAFPLMYHKVPLVTNSPYTKQVLKGLWLGMWTDLYVVPPGVRHISCEAKKFECPTILYVGSLHLARKRIDDLLKAFRKVYSTCPSVQLIIAGDGPDRKLLQDRASDLPVRFTGFVSEEEKHRLFEKAWIFASPSTKEGFGITWIEANAHGTPVVGYELGLDTVTPSCSIMVPPRDVEALSESLLRLIRDPKKRKEMADAARKNASRFDWGRSSRKFRRVAKQIM